MAYKIQQLGLGGVLDQAIAISKDHFVLLFSIMLFLLVPMNLITGAVNLAIAPQLPPEPTFQDVIRAPQEIRGHWPLRVGLGLINGLVVLPLTTAAVTHAISRLYLGRPVTAIGAFRASLPRVVPLILTWILMVAIIMVGFVLFIIPGIYFAIWYGLSQYVVIIEELSGMSALRRSKQLVHPQRGTFLALMIVMLVITLGVTWAAALIPQRHLALAVTVLLQAVTTIVWTSAGVVFYFSCRSALEHFDLQYLAESISVDEPATSDPESVRPLG